jgi:hypothetical protein
MAVDGVDREHILAPCREIGANAELICTIGGIVLAVAAELPQRRCPEVVDGDPIFQRRCVSAVLGIAAAAGDPLKADRREGVGGAEWIVVEDGIQRQRVLSENGQCAIGRRTDADVTLAVVKLARPARVGVGANGTSRLRKRKRAWRGVEAPRAQQSRLNDNLMEPLPGATYMSAMQAMHKPISITHHGVTNDVYLA